MVSVWIIILVEWKNKNSIIFHKSDHRLRANSNPDFVAISRLASPETWTPADRVAILSHQVKGFLTSNEMSNFWLTPTLITSLVEFWYCPTTFTSWRLFFLTS